MSNANVLAGSNRIKHALRNLLERWDQTRSTWNDDVRRHFEERQVRPLEIAVNSAINGAHELAEVLAQVRRECSERSETW